MKEYIKKSIAVISYSWKDFVEYRGYLMFWIAIESLGFFVMYFLWIYIYKKNSIVAGFTLNSMITYYFAAYIVRQFTVTYFDWNLIKKIKTGEFAHYLYRPLSHIQYYFFKNIGEKALRILLSLPFLAAITYMLRSYIIPPQHVLFLITATFISLLLNSWLVVLVSYVGFWTENGGTFIYLKDSLIYYLSGSMIPLVMFGDNIAKALAYSPFRYLVSFPVEIYLGQLTTTQMYLGLLISVVWLGVIILLERITYKFGVKKFTSVGN